MDKPGVQPGPAQTLCRWGWPRILEFDAQASSRPRQAPAARTANKQMSHEKILIVEDEENERSGLAELVTSWGYRVETAADGTEGLQKATQWGPSIVVTDLKMPRMGGIELLGHLAEQAQTIAVILEIGRAHV